MEFWGVEVKPNETLKVPVEDFKLLHISQVALGEVKNGKKVENVAVRAHFNDQKYVLATLSSERAPQVMFDLLFEQDLELSHGWKDGSVYFCGYIADNPIEDEDFECDSSDEDEAMNFLANGAPQGKPKASLKDVTEEDDSEEDDDSEDDDMVDSDDSEEEEEEKKVEVKPVKKPVQAAKRPAENAPKTPVPAKKAKSNTPQKSDGKKGGQTATPHPSSKQGFKKGKKNGNRFNGNFTYLYFFQTSPLHPPFLLFFKQTFFHSPNRIRLAMEFWGVEVKPNETLKVAVEDFKLLRISQVALGEVKNGKKVENVQVRVNFNGQKFVLATLSSERIPQLLFDLLFEKDVELSHGWKDGSVYFCGYFASNPDEDYRFGPSDDDDEEEAINLTANGAPQGKPKASLKDVTEEDDSESEDDDDSDDDMVDSDDSEEKEVKPVKKPVNAGKRPAESAPKTPVSEKKAKSNTPQKTDGKKGGHTATPYPSSKQSFKKGKKNGNR
ncbi:uncharacterized protein LOC111896615 [Lactuca sativa]|uniref:uncharacterized protein LOC111896615 n=1 Tax=Lactuca sativa TaxID=4236 RepID=UPI000CD9E2B7|nr:uncharacterized protein LOC111896615 [Lactuca sativa]